MRRKRMTLLAAVVAVCGAFGIMAGNASAIIIAEDGHWCGIDEPQRVPQLHEYLLSNEAAVVTTVAAWCTSRMCSTGTGHVRPRS